MIDYVTTHLCTTCDEYFEAYQMASIEDHICEECALRASYQSDVEEYEKRIAELKAQVSALRANQSSLGKWERVELPNTEEVRLHFGALITSIDLTGKDGPYALFRFQRTPEAQETEDGQNNQR